MPRRSATSLPDTREVLLEAALQCFARYGFEGTSIRLVASTAGKNSSLISYHFGSKEGLYQEVIRKVLRRLAIPIQQMKPDAVGNALPETERLLHLRVAIARVLSQIHAHTHLKDPTKEASTHLLLMELHSPKAGSREILRERFEPLIRELRACIQEIRPDLQDAQIDLWGTIVQGSCFGYALMAETGLQLWSQAEGWRDPVAISEQISSFLFLGLRDLPSAR